MKYEYDTLLLILIYEMSWEWAFFWCEWISFNKFSILINEAVSLFYPKNILFDTTTRPKNQFLSGKLLFEHTHQSNAWLILQLYYFPSKFSYYALYILCISMNKFYYYQCILYHITSNVCVFVASYSTFSIITYRREGNFSIFATIIVVRRRNNKKSNLVPCMPFSRLISILWNKFYDHLYYCYLQFHLI